MAGPIAEVYPSLSLKHSGKAQNISTQVCLGNLELIAYIGISIPLSGLQPYLRKALECFKRWYFTISTQVPFLHPDVYRSSLIQSAPHNVVRQAPQVYTYASYPD